MANETKTSLPAGTRPPHLITLDEVVGGAVYELAHSGWDGSCFWSESSRYLTDDAEGLPVLLPFFYEGPVPDFHWDGPNRIELSAWDEIRELAFATNEPYFTQVFDEVEAWLTEEDRRAL